MTASVMPEPGTLLVLDDMQYRFGVGPILCRVRKVITPVLFDEILWWHLCGDCANGVPDHHGGWQERELYVIASAVRGARATSDQAP